MSYFAGNFHSMNIIEYMIVSENNKNQLEISVNKAISLGWQPYGNLLIDRSQQGVITLAQPMVKYK